MMKQVNRTVVLSLLSVIFLTGCASAGNSTGEAGGRSDILTR